MQYTFCLWATAETSFKFFCKTLYWLACFCFHFHLSALNMKTLAWCSENAAFLLCLLTKGFTTNFLCFCCSLKNEWPCKDKKKLNVAVDLFFKVCFNYVLLLEKKNVVLCSKSLFCFHQIIGSFICNWSKKLYRLNYFQSFPFYHRDASVRQCNRS